MSEVTLSVEGVSKKFARTIRKAMLYGLRDISRAALIPRRFRSPHLEARVVDASRETAPFIPVRRNPREVVEEHAHDQVGLRSGEFWALRNLSFRIRRGECVGLVGANGAGKSTIFSVLSGIYGPTEGRAVIRGRLQALIALGAGFHPMLSGRENIFINAAILGLREREIHAKLQSIIEFAEIGEFIDSPIRTYSSGMLVRLGFSVAAHMDPDIMLIDEVLAVGDAAFQAKCQSFSMQLANSGKTIVIVTHNMIVVQGMCSRAVWLHRGRLVEDGDTDGVVRRYKDFLLEGARAPDSGVRGGLALLIRDMCIRANGERLAGIPARTAFVMSVELHAMKQIDLARAWVEVQDAASGNSIACCSMFEDGLSMELQAGPCILELAIEGLPITPGRTYRLACGVRDWTGQVLVAESYASPPLPAVSGSGPASLPAGDGLHMTQESALAIAHRWQAGSGTRLEPFVARR